MKRAVQNMVTSLAAAVAVAGRCHREDRWRSCFLLASSPPCTSAPLGLVELCLGDQSATLRKNTLHNRSPVTSNHHPCVCNTPAHNALGPRFPRPTSFS
jgi:hypothetical protein